MAIPCKSLLITCRRYRWVVGAPLLPQRIDDPLRLRRIPPDAWGLVAKRTFVPAPFLSEAKPEDLDGGDECFRWTGLPERVPALRPTFHGLAAGSVGKIAFRSETVHGGAGADRRAVGPLTHDAASWASPLPRADRNTVRAGKPFVLSSRTGKRPDRHGGGVFGIGANAPMPDTAAKHGSGPQTQDDDSCFASKPNIRQQERGKTYELPSHSTPAVLRQLNADRRQSDTPSLLITEVRPFTQARATQAAPAEAYACLPCTETVRRAANRKRR